MTPRGSKPPRRTEERAEEKVVGERCARIKAGTRVVD